MRRSFFLILVIVTMLALVLVVPVLAGGWAVVTLDQLPSNVSTGEVVQVRFMVRQHGRTPFESSEVLVKVQHVESGEQRLIEVKPEGVKGHYVADLTFSKPGRWSWEIHTGLYPDWQPMPDLDVGDPTGSNAGASSQAGNASSASIFPLPVVASVAVVCIIGLAGALWLSRRSRWGAVALAVIVLVAGGTYFAAAANNGSTPSASAPVQTDNQVTLGHDLFLAKGCVVCHVHRGMPVNPNFAIQTDAPDLTYYHNDPDYLTKWLYAPEEVKPGTFMPNLKLRDEEINALVAFINSSPAK
jgi:mono/diheme cytochrome c family protein